MPNRFDLTVVINLHREGLLCWPTLGSVSRAVSFARRSGFNIEILAVLDNTDQLTKDVIDRWSETSVRVLEINQGDLGFARNAGVASAQGEYIAFLDADDLWGETWLGFGLEAAKRETRLTVWHPEVSIYFGARTEIFHHVESDRPDFDVLTLVAGNLWTALSLTTKRILVEIPFHKTDLSRKIGFEDWAWNREVIGAGVIHKIVGNTAHLIRTKHQDSLNRAAADAGAIPEPTLMFRDMLPIR